MQYDVVAELIIGILILGKIERQPGGGRLAWTIVFGGSGSSGGNEKDAQIKVCR